MDDKGSQSNEAPEYDPIAKSWREASSFNTAWMKYGEKMTWTQRTGFAVFSFILFSVGLVCLSLVLSYLRNWDILGAIGWGFPCLVFIVPGVLGLRNVLRF